LYVDEDAMDGDLVRGLRARGVDVVTAADAGMIRQSDEEQLVFAATQGRALYSFNIRDFHEIHAKWAGIGRSQRGHHFSAAETILRRRPDSPPLAPDRLVHGSVNEKPGGISGPMVRLVSSSESRL